MSLLFFLALTVVSDVPFVAANKFIVPSGGYDFTVGEPTTLNWDPTTDGTVTLELDWGSGLIGSDDSEKLATKVPNKGKYTWTPPDDIADQPTYNICLIPDQPPQDFECTPTFSITGAGDSNPPSSTTTGSPTATGTSPSDSTSSPSPTPPDDNPDENAGLSTPAKAGIGIGIVALVLLLVVGGFFIMKRRRRSYAPRPDTNQAPRPEPIPMYPTRPPSVSKSEFVVENKYLGNELAGPDPPMELHAHSMQVERRELTGMGIREMDGSQRPGYAQRPTTHSIPDHAGAVELPAMERGFV